MNANPIQEPLHFLIGPGRAGWHCPDCGPAAVLSQTLFVVHRNDWPPASDADRCESCGITRTDMEAELRAMAS